MTAPEKVMWLIANRALKFADSKSELSYPEEDMDEVYQRMLLQYPSYMQDADEEVRNGDLETDLEAPFSRHYECDIVASELPDGTWVAYPYWHGGGQHGEPEAINWIKDAFDVEYEEEVVTTKKFRKTDLAK